MPVDGMKIEEFPQTKGAMNVEVQNQNNVNLLFWQYQL
jgi:hypothetical protein